MLKWEDDRAGAKNYVGHIEQLVLERARNRRYQAWRVIDESQRNEQATAATATIIDADGQVHVVVVTGHAANDGWRVAVPASVNKRASGRLRTIQSVIPHHGIVAATERAVRT